MDQVEVLGLDVHADDRVAIFEVYRGDLADLDAGDIDRLALAGRDRLGGGEVSRDVGILRRRAAARRAARPSAG
jgi:hypothetical protein